MRVLYLTINPNRESTTVPTEGWFRVLRPRGLEPVLVSNELGAFHQWSVSQDIPAYHVPLPFPNLRSPRGFLNSLGRIVRIARRHRIQMVHCNEHDAYPLAQYAARLLNVPVVVSVHFTLRDGFSRWAFRGRRAPARIFFVSRSSMEACREDVEAVVPENRWRVLYNAVELDHYVADEFSRETFRREHALEGAIVLGAACALRPRKQLEHLFSLAERLDRPDVRVLLAGGPVTGDEEYAASLLRDARARLGNRLVYVGHQSDLRAFYRATDVFVNTSHEESFGLSVLEAMASGCPVVGYPSTSVAEVTQPGGGVIVPQGDLDALVQAMRSFISAPGFGSSARDSARERAEFFDITRIAADLWSEYQAVLGLLTA